MFVDCCGYCGRSLTPAQAAESDLCSRCQLVWGPDPCDCSPLAQADRNILAHARLDPDPVMDVLPACDTCGLPVPPNNDAMALAHAAGFGSFPDVFVPSTTSRHFLPAGSCPGSPSRAQYIAGQPRDTRGYPYNPAYEERWRAAYAAAQTDRGE